MTYNIKELTNSRFQQLLKNKPPPTEHIAKLIIKGIPRAISELISDEVFEFQKKNIEDLLKKPLEEFIKESLKKILRIPHRNFRRIGGII